LDDGVETKREFQIEAELPGRHLFFTIPASAFAGMDWVIEHLGPAAITFPNQRDYSRTAIQSFSLAADDIRIYTHTGRRCEVGHWLSLQAAGAMGSAGAVAGLNVRLSGALSRYELRLPDTPERRSEAVRASLRLLQLGPPATSYPLRAATLRSVLGEVD